MICTWLQEKSWSSPVNLTILTLCSWSYIRYQVAPYLADASLEIILETFEPEPKPIHIVHREGRFASATARSFIDFIGARLCNDSVLQGQGYSGC